MIFHRQTCTVKKKGKKKGNVDADVEWLTWFFDWKGWFGMRGEGGWWW